MDKNKDDFTFPNATYKGIDGLVRHQKEMYQRKHKQNMVRLGLQEEGKEPELLLGHEARRIVDEHIKKNSKLRQIDEAMSHEENNSLRTIPIGLTNQQVSLRDNPHHMNYMRSIKGAQHIGNGLNSSPRTRLEQFQQQSLVNRKDIDMFEQDIEESSFRRLDDKSILDETVSEFPGHQPSAEFKLMVQNPEHQTHLTKDVQQALADMREK